MILKKNPYISSGVTFTLTPETGVTAMRGNGVVYGNLVIIAGQFVGDINSTAIATIPQAYRPKTIIESASGLVKRSDGWNLGYYELSTSGVLSQQFSASHVLGGNFVFVYTI